MDQRDACELLVERYGAQRARNLLGAWRMLVLYGEGELLRRRWIGRTGLEMTRRDLHLAGVPWPAPSEGPETTPGGG